MTDEELEPEPYREAHIRESLAADPSVGEMGLDVRVKDGTVTITGAVLAPERHDAILNVVRQVAPDLTLDDRVTVEPSRDAGEPEVVA